MFLFSTITRHQCLSIDNTRLISINNTDEDINNKSSLFDWNISNRIDEQSNTKLLFYIVAPMSCIIFILSILIIYLLTRKKHQEKPKINSHIYTNDVLYRTSNNKKKNFFTDKKSQQRLFPIKSEFSIQPIIHPAYLTTSSHSLPPLIVPTPSPPPPIIPPASPQIHLNDKWIRH